MKHFTENWYGNVNKTAKKKYGGKSCKGKLKKKGQQNVPEKKNEILN